jgi:hypothetical protein
MVPCLGWSLCNPSPLQAITAKDQRDLGEGEDGERGENRRLQDRPNLPPLSGGGGRTIPISRG